MNVTSAQYNIDLDGNKNCVKATIDGQEMFVPINETENRHWQAIQAWVTEGNTIKEAD